jgi:hypothetical protein
MGKTVIVTVTLLHISPEDRNCHGDWMSMVEQWSNICAIIMYSQEGETGHTINNQLPPALCDIS